MTERGMTERGMTERSTTERGTTEHVMAEHGTAGRRVGRSDVLLVLAGAALLWAAAYPRVEQARTTRAREAAADHVETLRAAALAFHNEHGAFPSGAPHGSIPAELAPHLPGDFSFIGPTYGLKWDRWEAVETVPPVDAGDTGPMATPFRVPAFPDEMPTDLRGDFGAVARADSAADPQALGRGPSHPAIAGLGGITVTTEDARILAALLERFGRADSFVRDGTWTLIVVPGMAAPGNGGHRE